MDSLCDSLGMTGKARKAEDWEGVYCSFSAKTCGAHLIETRKGLAQPLQKILRSYMSPGISRGNLFFSEQCGHKTISGLGFILFALDKLIDQPQSE